MIVRIITVRVKAGAEAEFERLTTENHEHSLNEPGILRFDVLKDQDQPGTYYLYEAYVDERATVSHKETDHYHRWKAAVAELLHGDRSSVTATPVAPTGEGSWRNGY